MKTPSQAPWIHYLEIDDNTGERFIRDDAPDEIKAKYQEFINSCDNVSLSLYRKDEVDGCS